MHLPWEHLDAVLKASRMPLLFFMSKLPYAMSQKHMPQSICLEYEQVWASAVRHACRS